MKYDFKTVTREQFLDKCVRISPKLGPIRKTMHFSVLEMADLAAKHAFLDKVVGEDVEWVREFLLHVRNYGFHPDFKKGA